LAKIKKTGKNLELKSVGNLYFQHTGIGSVNTVNHLENWQYLLKLNSAYFLWPRNSVSGNVPKMQKLPTEK
jgi:hypothetical protein